MITLDRWREFSKTPRTIVLAHAELIGLDHAPPIIVGQGEIRMPSPDQFTFTISGTPSDVSYALAELNRSKENPYHTFARFRLSGIDDRGIRWLGGWTTPLIDVDGTIWKFTGELHNLSTDDSTDTVAEQRGAEAIFLLRPGGPMSFHLAHYVAA